jgi:hypothetical protein
VNITDLPEAVWRKSTHSNGQANCVEVASPARSKGGPRLIAVRDSKNPSGPRLIFSPADWEAFTARVQQGDFAQDLH